VFQLKTDGTGFTNLHSFTYGDGMNPRAGLILSGNTLYATANQGGSNGDGTVFAVKTDGSGFTNLHHFALGSYGGPSYSYTNSDGGNPGAGLILSGNKLYGTAERGGSSDGGTVFALNTDGSGFTLLHDFIYGSGGANSSAALVLSGNTLYGTAWSGGSFGSGTVFRLLILPRLSIVRSGTNVIVAWPTNYTGFALQSAPAINGTFTNLPSATSPYTNAIDGAPKCFRLISN
jgi:uncharacterized repeat protein (TIGR03803 family)